VENSFRLKLGSKNEEGKIQETFIKFVLSVAMIFGWAIKESFSKGAKWVETGIKLAEDVTFYRGRHATSGRGEADVSLPDVSTDWFDLMKIWTDFLKTHSTSTARTITHRPLLQGTGIVLHKDDSPSMPCVSSSRGTGFIDAHFTADRC
jgi:hypothetical protein